MFRKPLHGMQEVGGSIPPGSTKVFSARDRSPVAHLVGQLPLVARGAAWLSHPRRPARLMPQHRNWGVQRPTSDRTARSRRLPPSRRPHTGPRSFRPSISPAFTASLRHRRRPGERPYGPCRAPSPSPVAPRWRSLPPRARCPCSPGAGHRDADRQYARARARREEAPAAHRAGSRGRRRGLSRLDRAATASSPVPERLSSAY